VPNIGHLRSSSDRIGTNYYVR